MRTILVIAGIVLAGATVIAVVQNDKNKDTAPEIQRAEGAPVGTAEPNSSPLTTPTINPAHGLAGHRCDLPVGAPLSTGAGAPAPVQNSPAVNMNAAPSPAGLKINPAHGLPGHRCDIQVGAPLT